MAAELTPKQEAFAVAIACEKLTQVEAYRKAYDAAGSSPETARKRANELATTPHVAARITALQRGAADGALRRAAYTLADAIREQEEIREMAVLAGNFATAATAAANKAKLAGHMVERKEIKGGVLEETDVEELEAMLQALRGKRKAETGVAHVDESNRPEIRPS